MRITVRLDDQLHAEVKRLANRTGRTLSAVIQDALREMLLRRRQAARTEWVCLPADRGSGLRPGVNLDSSAKLLNLMERISLGVFLKAPDYQHQASEVQISIKHV